MKQVRKASQYFHLDENTHSELIPWWQRGPIGYIAACLMVVAGVAIAQLEEMFFLAHGGRDLPYISASTLLLAVVLASLFWGVGPGLLESLLSSVALVWLLIRVPLPLLSLGIFLRLIPFIIITFIIAILTGQREVARRLIQKRAYELSAMNQELERANSLKDYFMVRAAHELRTPLTVILGETQLALHRLNKVEITKATCQRSFEMVEERAKHLRALIEDLLELSSTHVDEIPLHIDSCDFGQLCLEVVEEQRALSGQQIEYQTSSQPLILQADCRRLFLVVTNLMENAVRYSLEQAVIRVIVSVDQMGILLQISNKGFELTPEQQKQIFEPFYRTSFAENIFREGWGLGLTVSREIVKRHHGQIWVESEEGNTTFFVHIPFSAEKTHNIPV